VRRREFITLIGGTAAFLPFAASAQRPDLPLVAYLSFNRADATSQIPAAAAQEGLAAAGFARGKDYSMEYRWADQQLDRMPTLALDLIQRKPTVIFASGNAALQAVWAATRIIPIVAVDLTNDPVEDGMVESFAHPGGNVTGVFQAFPELASKWLQLLKEVQPQLSRVVVLWDHSTGTMQRKSVENAGNLLKVSLDILEVSTPSDFDQAFRAASQRGAGAILMLGSPLGLQAARIIAELGIQHHLPAFYWAANFARAGGLMAYGPNLLDTYRQAGVMTGKVLNGAQPADLPIEQPVKFELIINLRTAKTLGLTIPQTLLISADEVIE
jgi:putative tryptophan/tyrosine transport system substrate-binding protein